MKISPVLCLIVVLAFDVVTDRVTARIARRATTPAAPVVALAVGKIY